MNSRLSFLRRVRIHDGECGAVARALHHEAKINSSPAVRKNVFFTTYERKQMTKINFKRIALAVVVALGLGLFSSGPTSATIVSGSDTLTLSADSATISVGETASVTITHSFIAATAADSQAVVITNESRPTGGNGSLGLYITDSSNAITFTTANVGTTAARNYGDAATANQQLDYFGITDTTTSQGTDIAGYMGYVSGATALKQTLSFRIMAPTVTGTYVYRVYLSTISGSTAPVTSPKTFTLTVTANTSTVADATKSLAYVNDVGSYGGFTTADPAARDYKALEADSALVVSAGAAASPAAVGVLHYVVKNSSDTKVASVINADGSRTTATLANMRVKDSITVVISGPGLLAVSSYYPGSVGTRAKQVTLDWKETVVVYSDGTSGTATITSYIGSSVSLGGKFTDAAKTVTFNGRATTFTVSGGTTNVRAGSTIAYTGAADSATAAAATIRFVAKDASGNAVTSAALSVTPGDAGQDNSTFWAISSDTSILAAGEVGATYATSTGRRSPALPCTYDSTSANKGYWYCTGRVYDSGTVTLTVVDSRTVTPNGANYLTTTTSAVYKSDAFSVTFAGAGYTGTISLGSKTSFTVNEAVTVSMTCKDAAGRNVADGNSGTCWNNLNWKGAAPSFGENSSSNSAGGRFTNLSDYMTSTTATNKTTWVAGVDTMLAYMPTTAGTYTLMGRTGNATVDSEILSFTVTDPVATANAAAIAAAQTAADAATDAANEAIDAANAATDAANLSAEAADAATVAAEEARDAADAATAAVEELATQVATLMAALKAQITTLANTVAKIAKKVKA